VSGAVGGVKLLEYKAVPLIILKSAMYPNSAWAPENQYPSLQSLAVNDVEFDATLLTAMPLIKKL
jgi:hypothetical protein